MQDTPRSKVCVFSVFGANCAEKRRFQSIDTGLDTDHQSFNAGAYRYALEQQAAEKGMDAASYIDSLDLLDPEEVEAVLKQLNVYPYVQYNLLTDSRGWYVNEKVPFAINYVDRNYSVTHDRDAQGGHGSHVAGIAAANRFIRQNGQYVPALESVLTQGVAPDAQIIVMKVFGEQGGAYDSDYMVAIEDAIMLGCDVVNLSLGSNKGFARSRVYQDILDGLAESDTVVAIAAGNSGAWADYSGNGMSALYGDDVDFSVIGSPSTATNSLSVASVDNLGSTEYYISVADKILYYTPGVVDQAYTKGLNVIGGQDYTYVLVDGIGTAEQAAAAAKAVEDPSKVVMICWRGEISFFEKGNNAAAAGFAACIIANNIDGTINMDLTDYVGSGPCVSVSLADGLFLKASAQDQGNGLFVGTMYISDKVIAESHEGDVVVSEFSSWGVPGNLELKPEIAAPGGNIYSVNGEIKSGDAYMNLSGTSMASPQVAGMAAVLMQYIRENGLEEKTGLSPRVLATSLLMATAEPLVDGESGSYYPVLQQGSGLADLADAMAANACILMDETATSGASDGKVKVELGDDPAKDGVYNFGFTIHNFSDTAKTYSLTEKGTLMLMTTYAFFDTDLGSPMYGDVIETIGETGLRLTGVSKVGGDKFASMYYDANLDYLVVSANVNDENVLYAFQPDVCAPTKLGTFGTGLQPVISLYSYNPYSELTVTVDPAQAEIYEDETMKLTSKVYNFTSSNAVTWTSSDETVATVDGNGVVTAVAPGTVTITATSVEGTASASATITVKALDTLDLQLHAYVTTENGGQWVRINGSDMSVEVLAESDAVYTGAAVADGKVYASDLEHYYEIDVQNGYTVTKGDNFTDGDGADCLYILDGTSALKTEVTLPDVNTNELTTVELGGKPVYISGSDELTISVNADDGVVLYSYTISTGELTELAVIEDAVKLGCLAVYDEAVPALNEIITGSTMAMVVINEPNFEDKTVTVKLTEDVAVTNGRFEVTYNADELTYVGTSSLNASYAVNASEPGKLVIAYASADAIEAGAVIAALRFSFEGELDADVAVTVTERNEKTGLTETQTIHLGEPKAEVIATGWSGYTTWALTSDGVLTFTPSDEKLENGQTNLKNYWKVNGVLTLPWSAYADMITTVVIADGIHDIGQMAFYELKNLTTVVLGGDVTEIRNYAFKNCTALTSINLENVDDIREGAFYGCSALTEINLGENVNIEDWAFSKTPYAPLNP